MKRNTTAPNDKGFRFPSESISHAVWMYFRFSLSYRDVEELLAERGIIVTYETVRQWCLKFGQTSANERRRRPHCGDTWHLDEVELTIRGRRHSLWRAVDQYGNVLDILVQSRRNKQAAKRFFRKLLKGLISVPRVIITDKLKRYAAAKREIVPGVEHRQHKRLNNRAENSHQPTRLPERENAVLQIRQTRATLSLGFRPHLKLFPTAKAPLRCKGIPCHFTEPIPGLGRDDWGQARSIISIFPSHFLLSNIFPLS